MKVKGMGRVGHVFLFVLIFLSSCKNFSSENCIDLSNSFYYLDAGKNSVSIEQIQFRQNEFKKLEYWGHHNISQIAGIDGSYVWLKADFTIPEYLKGEQLSFLTSYVHFAEKTYLNGILLGENGIFPDSDGKNEHSSMYSTHFYNLNESLLNTEGKNTICMQIYSKGNAEASGICLVGPTARLKQMDKINSFLSSKINMLLASGSFIAFILFLSLFLSDKRKKNWHYYFFAMQNLFTVGFLSYFFASEVPWYTGSGISHLWYAKITICICISCILHCTALFTIYYVTGKLSKRVMIVQDSLMLAIIIAIVLAPDLPSLMKMTLPVGAVAIFKLCIGIYYSIRGLKIKEQRKNACISIFAFLPFYISVVFDISYHLFIADYSMVSYYPIFGHQLSIFVFIVILCSNINKLMENNKYLNENLEREIQLQTVDLTFANERLEQEIKRAEEDLEMASVVQKSFLQPQNSEIQGWDISILYEPLAKVSGDLYDYYCNGKNLLGFSLFDVSGHGIAASLVTMLSKNIIFKTFKKSLKHESSVSKTLLEINDSIIKAKGNIQNYLTGLLFHIDGEENGTANIQMSSGGHPYPVLYISKKSDIEELKLDSNQEQYGAIGIEGIEVSYPDINFQMQKNDILVVCTDGLFEACNENREQFGRQKVEQIVKENCDLSAQELKEKLIAELNIFMEDNQRDDDITIIVLKKL